MTGSELGVLMLFVGAFALFGGVLGWASFMESKAARKKRV